MTSACGMVSSSHSRRQAASALSRFSNALPLGTVWRTRKALKMDWEGMPNAHVLIGNG